MIYKRLIRLALGIMLYALGIVMTINANLGLAPWDAFHKGLSNTLHISFGKISILVGLVILLITYQLYESIGFGTITNIFAIGILIDLIFYIQLIPIAHNIILGIIMIFFGMVSIAFGSYFYIGSGFGTGPRDGLMVALTRVTKKPVGMIRGLIEMTVLSLGFLLGAKIGLGTLLLAFGIGPIIQFIFKTLKFDVHLIQHDSILHKVSNKSLI